MSPDIYARFLDTLDGQRSYFLASDIARALPVVIAACL